jgi:hypothetical protein
VCSKNRTKSKLVFFELVAFANVPLADSRFIHCLFPIFRGQRKYFNFFIDVYLFTEHKTYLNNYGRHAMIFCFI